MKPYSKFQHLFCALVPYRVYLDSGTLSMTVLTKYDEIFPIKTNSLSYFTPLDRLENFERMHLEEL